MSIENARKARASQALDKQIRTSTGQVMTKRAWLDGLRAKGGKLRTHRERNYAAEEKLREKLDRQGRGWSIPTGNPNHPLTKEYNAERAGLKDGIYKEELVIETPDGVFVTVAKFEADFFLKGGGQPQPSLTGVIDLGAPRYLSSPRKGS
jgi:hypothetical protein